MVPSSPALAQSETPTCWMLGVAVANLTATGAAENPGLGMWLAKSFLKKFQDSCPPIEYMATRLAESLPSLRSLSPMPGRGCDWLEEGSAGSALDSLAMPWRAPLKQTISRLSRVLLFSFSKFTFRCTFSIHFLAEFQSPFSTAPLPRK